MKVLTLKRVSSTEQGTYSVVLNEDKTPICLFLERPWKGNQSEISCIPDGEVVFKRVKHPEFGETFLAQDTKGRSGIYMHKGNVYTDSKGCLLFGGFFSDIGGMTGVADSGRAKDRFMAKLAGEDSFKLVIVTV